MRERGERAKIFSNFIEQHNHQLSYTQPQRTRRAGEASKQRSRASVMSDDQEQHEDSNWRAKIQSACSVQFLKAIGQSEHKRIYRQSIEQLKQVCYNIVRGQV